MKRDLFRPLEGMGRGKSTSRGGRAMEGKPGGEVWGEEFSKRGTFHLWKKNIRLIGGSSSFSDR